MNSLPEILDLTAIVRELSIIGGGELLERKLNAALRAQSCLADLRQAEAMCKAIDSLMRSARGKGSPQRDDTEAALLITGVIFYARGTGTGGHIDERGSIKVTSSLPSDASKADHQSLLDIRNKALAHVVNGTVVERAWHEDFAYLVRQPGGWLPAAASKRIQFDHATYARLKRQVPIVIDILRAKCTKKIDAVTRAINQLGVSEETVLRHRVNPDHVFGSLENARTALAGRFDGHSTFRTTL
jgi:hypothetical protein